MTAEEGIMKSYVLLIQEECKPGKELRTQLYITLYCA